jgi:hypothetical protein
MKIPKHLLPKAYEASDDTDDEPLEFGLCDGGDGSVEDALALARFLGLEKPWRIAVDIGADPVLTLIYNANRRDLTVAVGACDEDVSVLTDDTELTFVVYGMRTEWLADDGWLAGAIWTAVNAITEIHHAGEDVWEEIDRRAA